MYSRPSEGIATKAKDNADWFKLPIADPLKLAKNKFADHFWMPFLSQVCFEDTQFGIVRGILDSEADKFQMEVYSAGRGRMDSGHLVAVKSKQKMIWALMKDEWKVCVWEQILFASQVTFMQEDGEYVDTSLLSVLVSRSFALFDYDHDGKLDVAVAGPLEPRLQIYRNQIPDQKTGRAVWLRYRGGATDFKSQTEWSNRDGIGAILLVEFGGQVKMLQSTCGEGLASQNSHWLHVGLGDNKKKQDNRSHPR
ncbi:MAG: ASPIC/UnbV domain-containing protein [Planctomycetota bacterium]